MVKQSVYGAWADLLRYPGEGNAGRIGERIEQISSSAPDLMPELEGLRSFSVDRPETELEELFSRTFDSNAERALELGWHLHGETYARGAFMVRMRAMLRDHGISESSELPDHISHVLCLLARSDEVLSRALAQGVLSPALAKIVAGFGETDNPYLGVMRALSRYLEREFAAASPQPGDAARSGTVKSSGRGS